MKRIYIKPEITVIQVNTESSLVAGFSVKIFNGSDGIHRLDERYPVKEEDLPEDQEVGAKDFGKNSYDIWSEEEY